jgi:tetratricopeptide (TPR) repeat protein
MNHAERLKQWDEWIRQGDASKVRSLCRKINHKKIPRALLIEYAQVARRVGAPDLIVLWLRPIVRSEKILAQAATEKEKALYALGLLRLGSFFEASQILSEVDPERDPQVYFYRASMNINQWNYGKAIPDLKKYLHHAEVPAYSKLVGRLNLCASLVSVQKLDLAEKEILKLMRKLRPPENPLLRGNLLEIRSQLLHEQGKSDQALQDLREAAALLDKADERSLLYVEKWQLLIRLKSHPHDLETLNRLEALKARAQVAREWEIVRDCDLHRALTLKDKNLILRVFWGSHFKGYKNRVLRQFGETVIQDSFLWSSHGERTIESAPILDLAELAPTTILKKLFFILTRELYQPLRITEIVDLLYPGEYYHPVASPAKLHRLITRARLWLRQNGLPIEIQSYRNAYKIEFQAHCRLRLSNKLNLEKKSPLPSITEQGFFSVKDWALEKQISERTARLHIQKFVRQGLIEMQARGPRTRYRIK